MTSTGNRKGYQHPIGGGQAPKYAQRAADADRPDRRKVIEDLKARFDGINRRAIQLGTAWLVSIPGDPIVDIEVLPGSPFLDELRERGYSLREEPPGERILPHAIEEKFGRAADGTLVPITAGSTLPVVHKVVHAGIAKVERFSFLL